MALQTSASEISRYRGNAASALGSSDNAGANIIAGDTDLARLNQRLDLVSANNFQTNKDRYEQKLKDRDELFQKLAIASKTGTGGEMPLLPDDRDLVRARYLKPMRDMMIENPDLKGDPDQWIKFQQLAQDFDEAKVYAQHRYQMVTTMDQAIATEKNPDKRAKMQEHRDKAAKQGIFQEVTPYQPILDYSDNIFVNGTGDSGAAPAGAVAGKKGAKGAAGTIPGAGGAIPRTTQEIVGDKIVTTTRTHTPIGGFINDVMNNYVSGADNTLKYEMDKYAEGFQRMPDEMKAQQIREWNATINKANQDEGLKPGDLHYVEPINATILKDADGKERVIVNETAPRLVLAASLQKNYRDATSQAEEISKLPAELKKLNWEATQGTADQHRKTMAEIAKYHADAEKTRVETKNLRETGSPAQKAAATGDYFINGALQLFDPDSYKDLPKIEEDPRYAQSGITGTVLMTTDKDGNVASSLSERQLNLLSKPALDQDGKPIKVQPKSVTRNVDAAGNPYLTVFYQSKSAKDKSKDGPIQTKVFRPSDYIKEDIEDYQGRYATGKDEGATGDNVTRRFTQRTGGSINFNTDLMSLANDPAYKGLNRKREKPGVEKPGVEKSGTVTPGVLNPFATAAPRSKGFEERENKRKKAFD